MFSTASPLKISLDKQGLSHYLIILLCFCRCLRAYLLLAVPIDCVDLQWLQAFQRNMSEARHIFTGTPDSLHKCKAIMHFNADRLCLVLTKGSAKHDGQALKCPKTAAIFSEQKGKKKLYSITLFTLNNICLPWFLVNIFSNFTQFTMFTGAFSSKVKFFSPVFLCLTKNSSEKVSESNKYWTKAITVNWSVNQTEAKAQRQMLLGQFRPLSHRSNTLFSLFFYLLLHLSILFRGNDI